MIPISLQLISPLLPDALRLRRLVGHAAGHDHVHPRVHLLVRGLLREGLLEEEDLFRWVDW